MWTLHILLGASADWLLESLHLPGNGLGHSNKFFGSELLLGIGEDHVLLLIDGDEVDVGVGNFHTHDGYTYFLALEGATDGTGYLLGKEVHGGQFFVFEVEDVIHFTLGDDQRVSLLYGVDVKESSCKSPKCFRGTQKSRWAVLKCGIHSALFTAHSQQFDYAQSTV